ncbi:uncharacterized protein LOC129600033 [Paramacrobiotus metropolitanus]|uniref:uncharacterized protein LOC129600033 n=1 Tax=Paramacrobiotus metropolitanus TaxID=2943436 RepID=UPI0024456188|nr:uncharacterized protein LOC129600033 [Paramacrobiotus metropolitanus]
MNADWEMEHKFECTLMKRITDYRQKVARERPPFSVVTILNLKIQKSVLDHVPGLDGKKSVKEILLSLNGSRPTRLVQEITEFTKTQIYKDLMAVANPNPADRPTETDFIDTQLRVIQNLWPLSDFNSKGGAPCIFGSGLFLEIGRTHGSGTVCMNFNAMQVFPGKTLRVVALDDISGCKGLADVRWCNPMFVGWFSLPAKQRREYFQKSYGRACGCRKCTPDYEAEINPLKCVTTGCHERIPSDERALMPCAQCGAINEPRLRALRGFVEKHEEVFQLSLNAELTGDTILPAIIMHKKVAIIEELNKLDILHPGAHLRFVCGWIVTDVYEEQKRFEDAWALYQDCTLCIRQIFPNYHVSRSQFLSFAGCFAIKWAEHVMKDPRGISAATARFFDGVLEEGIGYLKESAEIYSKLFGQLNKFAPVPSTMFSE